MKCKLTQENGFSLILTIVTLLSLLLLTGALYKIVRAIMRESVFQTRLAQSEAIAEAGIEDALYQLRLNSATRTGFSKNLAGGSYTVSFSTGTPAIITSVGYSPSIPFIGAAKTQIQATAQINGATGNICTNLAGTGNASVQANVDSYDSSVSTTPATFGSNANICSNAQVQINTANIVKGDVVYGSPPAPGTNLVTGTISQSTFTRTVPFHDGSGFATINNNLAGISPISNYNAVTRDLIINGNQNVTLQPGVYYLNKFNLNGSSTLILNTAIQGITVYLTGDLSFNGTITNQSQLPNRFAIYPQGNNNITLKHKVDLKGIVEGPNASITTTGVVYGKLAGANLSISAPFHYDVSLSSGTAAVTRATWQTGTWFSNPQ